MIARAAQPSTGAPQRSGTSYVKRRRPSSPKFSAYAAHSLRQLLAQLPQRTELTDEAREEIHEAAEETLEVITSPEPKPSKVRRMVDGIVGALGRVATTLGHEALQGAGDATTQWAHEHAQLLLGALTT